MSSITIDLSDVMGSQAGGIFDIWQLLTNERAKNEEKIRALCRNAFLGDDTSLCRVLGRYKIFADTRDVGISTHLLLDGFWEMWVTEEMLRHVRPGMTVLDIGANLGYFTVLLADLVGPSGRVLAFEPNPEMIRRLRRSVEVNGFGPTTTVHGFALGEIEGAASIHIRTDYPGGGHVTATSAIEGAVPIEVRRLDSVEDAIDVDFIKMDVEGFEQNVWHGMRAILAKGRPLTIFMEFTIARFADADQFLNEILVEGFSLSIIDFTRGKQPISREELFAQSHLIDHMLVFERGDQTMPVEIVSTALEEIV